MAKTKSAIYIIYEDNVRKAKDELSKLDCNSNTKCRIEDFKGLSGWVFEQTIQSELRKKLKSYNFEFSEQCKLNTQMLISNEPKKLKSNGIIDLKISNGIINDKVVFIEIKLSGLYNIKDVAKYEKYHDVIVSNPDYTYLYITAEESCAKYIKGIQHALEVKNSFFLDTGGINEWQRFADRIVEALNT